MGNDWSREEAIRLAEEALELPCPKLSDGTKCPDYWPGKGCQRVDRFYCNGCPDPRPESRR